MEGILGLILLFAFLVLGTVIYFAPSIVAYKRQKQNKAAIMALNFFLGWSLIGWVISLVWALTQDNVA